MQGPPEELVAQLAQRHGGPAPVGWTPLTGGQTNRSWRVRIGGAAWVVKLYAGQNDNPLFPNSARDETALLRRLAPTGLAPQLIGELSTSLGPCVIYRYQDGKPWREDPALVGQALSRLHRLDLTDLPDGMRRLQGGTDRLAAQTGRIIGLLPEPEQKRLQALRPDGPVATTGHLALLHGDPVPGNVIVDGSRITLIDWQCPAIGDPVEDLAIFLSPAMQQIYRGRPLSDTEIADFIEGYDIPNIRQHIESLAPWHHWRMAAYCAWKSAQGCGEYETAGGLEIAALTA